MTIEKVYKAIGILIENGVTGYSLAAEHDILYLCGEDDANRLPPEASKALEELGCHKSSDTDGWAAFV